AAVPNFVRWDELDMNYELLARIEQDTCIQCGKCHIACEDTAHQAISATRDNGVRRYEVIDEECVGCNLCALVCPAEGCITMEPVDNGKDYVRWLDDPRNPANQQAAE
ncbi:MAG TPA: 4Fe-4S dicluster-binding protein, partial [Alphaproteobacteria bacterium]|nr:4Fe-4S dicluster-binding protein [Alphaproteobacteria bacterium]